MNASQMYSIILQKQQVPLLKLRLCVSLHAQSADQYILLHVLLVTMLAQKLPSS